MKHKILNQITTMLTASIAFVAALAWNDAVQSIFEKLDYFKEKGIIARFIYAFLVTIIAVGVTSVFAKYIKEEK